MIRLISEHFFPRVCGSWKGRAQGLPLHGELWLRQEAAYKAGALAQVRAGSSEAFPAYLSILKVTALLPGSARGPRRRGDADPIPLVDALWPGQGLFPACFSLRAGVSTWLYPNRAHECMCEGPCYTEGFQRARFRPLKRGPHRSSAVLAFLAKLSASRGSIVILFFS